MAPATRFKLFQGCASYFTAATTSSLESLCRSVGKYRSVFTVDGGTRWWERRVDFVSWLYATINVLNLANEALDVFWTRPGNPGNRTVGIDFVTRSFDLTSTRGLHATNSPPFKQVYDRVGKVNENRCGSSGIS